METEQFKKELRLLCSRFGVVELVGIVDIHPERTAVIQVSLTGCSNEFYNQMKRNLTIIVTKAGNSTTKEEVDFYCRDCKQPGRSDKPVTTCPQCNSNNIEILND